MQETDVVLEAVLDVDLPPAAARPPGDVDRIRRSAAWLYGVDLADVEPPGRDHPVLVAAALRALADGGYADVTVCVMALSTPDVQHEQSLAALFSQGTQGEPSVVAVTEQGLAGPFTALRLAALELASTEGRAVVLVPDLRPVVPAPGGRLTEDRMVVLVLGRSDAGRPVRDLQVRRTSGRLPAAHRSTCPGDGTVTVAGRDVGGGGTRVVVPRAGAFTTGVWEVLARLLKDETWAGSRIAVVEEDHALGYRCELLLGPSGAAPDLAGYRRTASAEGASAAVALAAADLVPTGPVVVLPTGHEPGDGYRRLETLRTDGADLTVWRATAERGATAVSDWDLAMVWIRLGLTERLLADVVGHLQGRKVGGAVTASLGPVKVQVADVLLRQLEAEALLEGADPTTARHAMRQVTLLLDDAVRDCIRLLGAAGFADTPLGRGAYVADVLGDLVGVSTGEPA